MSIKIYRAYRLKKNSSFWPLVKDIQKIGELKLKAKLSELFLTMMDGVDTNSEEYQKLISPTKFGPALTEGNARARIVDRSIHNLYKLSSGSHERSAFDFDVSVAFREWKGRLYAIPYCDMYVRDVLDFLDEDPRIEDYHYQNSCDKPDEISNAEWSRRRRVWSALGEDGPWQQFVVAEVCSFSAYWRLNPYFDLARAGAFRKWDKKTSVAAEVVRNSSKDTD